MGIELAFVNSTLMVYGIFEAAMAVICSVLTIRLVYAIQEKRVGKTRDTITQEKNLALAVYIGVTALSYVILVSPSVELATDVLRTMVQVNDVVQPRMILISLGYFVGLYMANFIFTYLLYTLTRYLILRSKSAVNQFREIIDGNLSAAVLISLFALSMAVFCRPAMSSLLSGFIDYQTLNRIGSRAQQPIDGSQISPQGESIP